MMGEQAGHLDRLHALQVELVTQGLLEEERRELDRLLLEFPPSDADDLEWAAASLSVCLRSEPPERMPAALRSKVERDAVAWLARKKGLTIANGSVTGRSSRRPDVRSWLPWLAAAAGLLLALVAWWPWEASSMLLAADLQVFPWASNDGRVIGEVGWSPSQQKGYMKFRGLAANDPTIEQYQLWIFDAVRDERYPVDGGVFDVGRTDDEVVIPISAKLPLSTPTLFAITVERPGGVVVSDRSRLILTAPATAPQPSGEKKQDQTRASQAPWEQRQFVLRCVY